MDISDWITGAIASYGAAVATYLAYSSIKQGKRDVIISANYMSMGTDISWDHGLLIFKITNKGYVDVKVQKPRIQALPRYVVFSKRKPFIKLEFKRKLIQINTNRLSKTNMKHGQNLVAGESPNLHMIMLDEIAIPCKELGIKGKRRFRCLIFDLPGKKYLGNIVRIDLRHYKYDQPTKIKGRSHSG